MRRQIRQIELHIEHPLSTNLYTVTRFASVFCNEDRFQGRLTAEGIRGPREQSGCVISQRGNAPEAHDNALGQMLNVQAVELKDSSAISDFDRSAIITLIAVAKDVGQRAKMKHRADFVDMASEIYD